MVFTSVGTHIKESLCPSNERDRNPAPGQNPAQLGAALYRSQVHKNLFSIHIFDLLGSLGNDIPVVGVPG
jgi:hypothetical protein